MGDTMKRRSGIVVILVLMFLILAAFSNVIVFPAAVAPSNSRSTPGVGWTELVVDFPSTGVKTVIVPANANITSATVNFTTMANDDGIYPENIELRFGEVLPIDWAFQGSGHGAYGYQRYFKESQVRVNMTYDVKGYNDTVSIILPKNAEVSQASVKLTAFEYDHWESGITELNIPDGRTWQQDPFLFVFQNRLWCFIRNYNSTETDESDGDISYTYTTDGSNWQSMTELTPNADTPDGYPGNGPTHLAGDFHPFVVEFDGKMGVFWGSMSFYNIDQPNWQGITNGSDRDIVVRWYDPTGGWDNDYIEITHPTENADESNYTRNPGDDPDVPGGVINPWHRTDQRPNAVEFKNKVYCIWMANNTGNTTFRMHRYGMVPSDDPEPWWHWNNRGDIIVSSSDDGIHWSKGYDLTAYDEWEDIDFAPSLCVYKNKLYALWETNGRWYNKSGIWTKKADVQNSFDFDLIYRWTEDGENWSDYHELTLQNDTANYERRMEFSYPDEDPRLVVFTDPKDNKDKLFCIYRTRNVNITNGTDYDIVFMSSEDGVTWTHPIELTDKKINGGYDNKPELTVFNNKLYAVWRREQGERWSDDVDGDIVTRHFDGYGWSPLQEVSPFDGDGTGRDDFYPNSVGFFNGQENKFYSAWVTRNRGLKWTQGTDADVVVRSMRPSDLPLTTGLDVGQDNTWELRNKVLNDANPSVTVDMTSTIQDLIGTSSYVGNHLYKDDFGNEFVEFPLNVSIPEPGRIRFDNLKIWYNCTIEAGDGITYHSDAKENPFADKMNKYIKTHQSEADNDGNIEVKLELTSPSEGRIKMHDFFLEYNYEPQLKLLTPEVNKQLTIESRTGLVPITWEDNDIDDDAIISLYYHKGKYKTYDGTLIAENIKENDMTDSYTWLFTENDVEDGVYSIFGVITDGINVIYSYAPGIIDVTWKPQEPPYIKITQPDGKFDKVWRNFRIEWDDSGKGDEESGAMIYLYYSPVKIQNLTGIDTHATQIDINGDGYRNLNDYIYENKDGSKGQFIWDISHLPNATSWYIIGKIDDDVNPPEFDCSEARMTKDFIIPPDMKLKASTEITEDIWETHNTRPEINLYMPSANYQFHVTVYKGTNNDGIKIFEVKNITEFDVIIDPEVGILEYGETYYIEAYAISQNGGTSGIVNLTFTLVNIRPAPPTVNFSPNIPTSSESLVCLEPPEKIDSDGDTITYSYKWEKDGKAQDKFEDIRTIPPNDLKKGEEWTVIVTPFDGIETGNSREESITIMNTLPEIEIENPVKSGKKYYSNININVYGSAVDIDNDTLIVEWYLDLDMDESTKENITRLYVDEFEPIVSGGIEALNFERKFTEGKHNLTLFVMDGDVGKKFEKGIAETVRFEVGPAGKIEDEGKDDASGFTTTVAIGSILAIIVVIILLIVLLQFRKRKPKTEREKLYGKDKGLKPGEMYPVEEDEGSYFGDDLDRKGASSLESGAPPPPATPPPAKPEAVAPPEKTPQLPPPSSPPSEPKQPNTEKK